eukprot:2955896-Alexandrium_andersonii.AAC.1
MTELSNKIGSDSNEHTEFHTLLKDLVDHMVKHGSRGKQAPWADFKRKLEFKEEHAMRVIQPDDELIPWAEYLELHGNPAQNGLGHKEATLNGVRG